MSKEGLKEIAEWERKYQYRLEWQRSNMGRNPEIGHCRNKDGVSREQNGEFDAVGGLAEEGVEAA